MFCPTCGSQLPEDAQFCGSCGTQLGEQDLYPVPAAGPMPAAGTAPKRRRAPIIAAIVAATVVVLAGAGFAAWWFLLRPEPVYVFTKAEAVWTNEPEEVSSEAVARLDWSTDLLTARIWLGKPLNLWSTKSIDVAIDDRGARRSMRTESLQLVNEHPAVVEEEYVYELDDQGNRISGLSSEGEAEKYLLRYDEEGRMLSRYMTGIGACQLFTYNEQGRLSCVDTYSGGAISIHGGWYAHCVFDGEGHLVEFSKRYAPDDDGYSENLSLNDGIMTSFSNSLGTNLDIPYETDDEGRIVAVHVPEGETSWKKLYRSESEAGDLLYVVSDIYFEYDDFGNVTRAYAPWKSDALREEFEREFGTVPNEENIFDYRFEYERVDNPTPTIAACRNFTIY